MTQKYVTTANTGNTVDKYHIMVRCPSLVNSKFREINDQQVELRDLDLCGQCERLSDGECRECGDPLPVGYICDECDTVEGWVEQ